MLPVSVSVQSISSKQVTLTDQELNGAKSAGLEGVGI